MKISDFITNDFRYNWEFIESIPEFAKLKECEQSPRWHGEGSAWEHTKKVCVAAQDMVFYKFGKRGESRKKIFLASALFHDIGKGVTTFKGKDNEWHSYGHESVGERITRLILWDEDWYDREQVCALVRWHMEPSFIFNHKSYLEKLVELSKIVNLENLVNLKICDCIGSEMSDAEFKKTELEKLNTLLEIVDSMNMVNIPTKKHMPWILKSRWGEKPVPVYVMIGLPGAGKTTLINKIAESERYTNYVTINKDKIKEELGITKEDVLDLNDKDEIKSVLKNKLISAINGNSEAVFIDDLNLTEKSREEYKIIADKLPVKWIYVYVEAEEFSENISRKNGEVTCEEFNDMISSIDWPYSDEYDVMMVETNRN